jgi:hypothetical protein
MEHDFRLYLTNRALNGEMIAQITKDHLYAMIGAKNVAPSYIPLQRVQIVSSSLRETFKQAAANKSGRSGYKNSHTDCFLL